MAGLDQEQKTSTNGSKSPYALDTEAEAFMISKDLRHQLFVDQFRQASPYVNVHRGCTFVIYFGGDVINELHAFRSLIADFAILNSLGIRLVLVAGARPQIEQRLQARGLVATVDEKTNMRITSPQVLEAIKDAVGSVRVEIEAQLSVGLIKSPLAGADIHVASGNLIMAKPLGVRRGVDYMYSGEVRRVESDAIIRRLDNHEIVLLSPLGYSITGEVFNCNSEEVAYHAAAALGADKLIYLTEVEPVAVGTFTRSELKGYLKEIGDKIPREVQRHLSRGLPRGVRRMHLVNRQQDGALLIELFTRDGVGTMVLEDLYEGMRRARLSDITAVEELIKPLEAAGVLIPRSREKLRSEIDSFFVVEREDRIIGCAALYLFPEHELAEVACLAIHPDYRAGGKGDILLGYLEKEAW
eukprot:CAMPEP_0184650300 /NCGR_PEP_ID=MMETSP0308-20130426/7819_1 /TAXON_ID=38269 /ORGANISM="Gloeochaete witrockiana, Strain SAG 46.84" /LENGTH=412 /DNA_ID=CAMNT_0027083723 /DNA_START=202 /DNA_END=1437 /DNA_ORIENTATION=+